MKALILGGTQFMGVHMVNKLIDTGHDVTIATRGVTPDGFGNKVERLVIDRQDPESLNNALTGKHYDVTIDNIAYASNDIKHLLDNVSTGKYILTSSVAVYSKYFHIDIQEEEFDPIAHPLKWGKYDAFPYDEGKRQAETALLQTYNNIQSAAVRFPFIYGADDYTKRLYFYVENVFHQRPMFVNNQTSQLSFIHSQEAGHFLAHIATAPLYGGVNVGSNGTISLEEIIRYTEEHTSKKAVFQDDGAPGPMNGTPSFSIDTSRAAESGFEFKDIKSWIYPLIDHWIKELQSKGE